MGMFRVLGVGSCLIVGSVLAQGPASIDATQRGVVFENRWVRVVRRQVPPNFDTRSNMHPDRVSIDLPDGTSKWQPTLADKHVEENVPAGDGLMVELKDYSGDSPNKDQVRRPEKDPITAAPEEHQLVFANKRVRVIRFRLPPHTKAPEHQHLATVMISLPDGGVTWMEPKIHSPENTTDTPAAGILVELLEGANETAPTSK